MSAPAPPSLREATGAWVRIAAQSFGGPAGQIAVVHRIVVEEKGWLSEERFLHALSYCMLLPGPEAQQLTTYVGWLMHGVRGGLIAGSLFILPGFVSILALSIAYVTLHDVAWVSGIFFGLKPAVLAIVFQAVVRIGGRALKGSFDIALAAVAFVALFLFSVPFPMVVAAAGVAGLIRAHLTSSDADALSPTLDSERPNVRRLFSTVSIWLLLWWVPILALWMSRGGGHVLVSEALFFSKTAVVTFGGAYAVLSYIAQQAVDALGWLTPLQMLDGLGMAETTPGPLIQVVQFVGFMGAAQNMSMHPVLAGTVGAVVTTWVTFAPCFLFIFAGAPYVEHLRGNRNLNGALRAITAAVVGVVLNLGIWFAMHTLFAEVNDLSFGLVDTIMPAVTSLDLAAIGIAAVACIMTFYMRAGMIVTLGVGALVGVMVTTLF